jgi:hypothetical protein
MITFSSFFSCFFSPFVFTFYPYKFYIPCF